MDESILSYIAGGGGGGVLVGLLWLLGQWLEKRKPPSQVAIERSEAEQVARAAALAHREAELAELRGQVGFWRRETERNQEDITKLRLELRRMSAERHHFYEAIIRCTVEHPTTAEWWGEELQKIQTKVGAKPS